MSFNDTFLFDLEKELRNRGLLGINHYNSKIHVDMQN